MTKDRALILLGMSSRMRTKIMDLDENVVKENSQRQKGDLLNSIQKLQMMEDISRNPRVPNKIASKITSIKLEIQLVSNVGR